MNGKAVGPALCPSAPAAPGAALIGVVEVDGRVVNLVTPLRVEAGFAEAAGQAGLSLGKRFRFASPCQQERCGHWAGHECGLIGQLRQAVAERGDGGDAATPPCAIRAQCRWWRQSGRDACAVCPQVVTDQRPPAATPAAAG